MNVKPKTWLACCLALFLQPLAHLYAGSIKWAAGYLLLGLAAAIGDIWLQLHSLPLAEYAPLRVSFALVSVLHILFILKKYPSNFVRKWYSRWYGLIGLLVLMFSCVVAVKAFFYESFLIPAASMSPGINPGDLLLVEKWGYGHYSYLGVPLYKTAMTKKLLRGDLVVFEYPEDSKVNFVKRIVGLPGDEVVLNGKDLSINGLKLSRYLLFAEAQRQVFSENLNQRRYKIQLQSNRAGMQASWTVPAGHYFVMGDNRDNSNDSRFWGFLAKEQILGKVALILQKKTAQTTE
ncbi:MAG: signal peptidase I [Pseudomonadales bacterium]|nr:signal peptidase I [Pseudomonadales bacterium]NRA17912.1 signal peptidase I [Oceanospirillaceae bacterium]